MHGYISISLENQSSTSQTRISPNRTSCNSVNTAKKLTLSTASTRTNLSLSTGSSINGTCKKIKLQTPKISIIVAHRKASSTEHKTEKRAWINILFSGESEALHLRSVYHLTKQVLTPDYICKPSVIETNKCIHSASASASSVMSEHQSEEVQQIEKLYEFSERLNASKDKSQVPPSIFFLS